MIGILAAMDTEVEAIKNIMEIKKEELYQGMNFTYGTIENKESRFMQMWRRKVPCEYECYFVMYKRKTVCFD